MALALFAWTDASMPGTIPTTALFFLLGDLSGLLLLVPPALLFAEHLLERRRARRETVQLDRHDQLVAGGLFALATCFVLFAVFLPDRQVDIKATMTPALIPILIGAMRFGYTISVGLFRLAATLLLTISAVVAVGPNVLALQTVLIVCCIATLSVGAATSDRVRLISCLDSSIAGHNASVADRARQLDAENAALARSNAELRAVATTDHLIGLANRRAFEATLRHRLNRKGPEPAAGSGAAFGAAILKAARRKREPAA